MRMIGVLDLLAGRAVHARGGQRDSFEPVRGTGLSASTDPPYAPGDAVALARWYMREIGLTELYVADLDAISNRPPQDAVVASLAALGAPIWLDAGIASVSAARHALELAAAVVVVGLETLPSYDALAEICAKAGGDRVAFSLDLRGGEPVVAAGVPNEPAHVVAERAAGAGAGALIVIDLARVGTGTGIDLALIARVRAAVPELTLLAGGGIGGTEDVARLADAGCDGALVATALHDGRLGAADVAAAHRLARKHQPQRAQGPPRSNR
jgi:phosphoribosylformimino-5-aminoimidazole carboxamide ribotide isomerase